MKLTDKQCRTVKPQDKLYILGDGQGMFLYVYPNGSKYWRFKYRIDGKQKLLAFGVYPEVTLKEARNKREEARTLIRQGIDPSSHKKAEQREKRMNNANTFKAIAEEWLEVKKDGWSEGYYTATTRRLEQNIFPEIGDMPIKEIEPPILLDVLKKIQERGANEMAYRVKAICGEVFRYAIVTGRGSRDPSQDLHGALKAYKKENYAAIEPNEIPQLLHDMAAHQSRSRRHTYLATKMLMLTFVRTSEMIEATWDEFDFKEKMWTIPEERMKMGKPHLVPLSKQVIDILNELKNISEGSKYIFPSHFNKHKHMSNNTVLKSLGDMGYKGRMTGHGFRALAMITLKEKLRYQHEIIDRQLAHTQKSKIDRAYDRSKFLEERTVMMQDWADYIDKQAKSNVIEKRFA